MKITNSGTAISIHPASFVGTLPVDEGKYKKYMYTRAGIIAAIVIVLTALIGGVFR